MNDPQDPMQQGDQASSPQGGQPQGDDGAQQGAGQFAGQQGGGQQQGGQPQTGQPVTGQQFQPPADQKDLSGIMEENVDVSGLVANAGQNQQDSQALTSIKLAPHPKTVFDEQNFLSLLAGSISLTITEKKRIIEAVPQLSQFQIDELIKIFDEEKGKFQELEKKHADQIAELEKQHAGSWQDMESQKEEEEKKRREQEEADNIKKQLGLM